MSANASPDRVPFASPALDRGRKFRRVVRWRPVLLACWLAGGGTALAHNPDTSYVRIAITPQEVEFKFAYDLSTLQRITRLDTDRNQLVSRAEFEAATPAIQQFLRDRVRIRLNQHDAGFAEAVAPVWPEDAGAGIPEVDHGQRLLIFIFRNPVLSAPEDVTITFDFFETFGPAHVVLGVFAWEDREDEVLFTRFEPDFLYDTGHRVPSGAQAAQYFKLGVKHIFLGYDHIAFLLALLFVKRFRDLVWVITAFTVAHTLTLTLAVLQLVTLPSHAVEIAIAATIMYVAAENWWVKDTRHRWLLTFGFGLVHGFGFANVLRELGLPARGLARSLVSFNLGVEAGQLVIVGALWPLLWWIHQRSWAAHFRFGLSGVIFLFGAAWFVERAFRLEFMPF